MTQLVNGSQAELAKIDAFLKDMRDLFDEVRQQDGALIILDRFCGAFFLIDNIQRLNTTKNTEDYSCGRMKVTAFHSESSRWMWMEMAL